MNIQDLLPAQITGPSVRSITVLSRIPSIDEIGHVMSHYVDRFKPVTRVSLHPQMLNQMKREWEAVKQVPLGTVAPDPAFISGIPITVDNEVPEREMHCFDGNGNRVKVVRIPAT